MKTKKLYKLLIDKLKKSGKKTKPKCRHFGVCGGCDMQDISYKSQLELKKKLFLELADHLGAKELFRNLEIKVHPSPKRWRYRQRMDYVFAFEKAGLRIKNKFDHVVNLEECHIVPKKAFKAFLEARNLADKLKLESYNNVKHVGFLRYFVVRQTGTREVMMILVTKTKEREKEVDELAEALLKKRLATSIHWMMHEGVADISFGQTVKIYGKEYIEEKLLGKKYIIGPNTFFQPNRYVAAKIYGKIQRATKKNHWKNILDLYSGTASIATALADSAEKITAVEISKENEELAKKNIERNKIKNIHFILKDVSEFLKTCNDPFDVVIIDPPRSGLEEKGQNMMLKFMPNNIISMSCNPVTLIKDIRALSKNYRIKSIQIFDMFPQTKHLETLIFLEKKK